MTDKISPQINNADNLLSFILKSKRFSKKYQTNDQYKLLIEGLKIFTSKYSISVLLLLRKIIYSSRYEIKEFLGFNIKDVIEVVSKLESLGFVKRLSIRSPEYKIFINYWRNKYVTGRKEVKMYYLPKDVIELIDSFADTIIVPFDDDELSEFENRGQEWISHLKRYETEQQAHEMAIKNAIGYCSNPSCKKLIGAGSVEDRDYYQYSRKHRLCRECHINGKVDPKTIKEWLNER